MLMNQDVLLVLAYVIASGQRNNSKAFAHLPASSSKTVKKKVKCVSLLDISIDGFSSAKLYQQRISHLKSELSKVILPVKISQLISFCGFRGGNGKFAEIRAGLLSRLAASPLNFDLAALPRVLVLQQESARRLAV